MRTQLATIRQTLHLLTVEMAVVAETAMGLVMEVLAAAAVAQVLRHGRPRATVAVHRQMLRPREVEAAMVARVASAVMVATVVAQVLWRR